MRIYLAGPISGKSYNEVMGRLMKRKALLEESGYEVLHPMTGKGHLREELEFRVKDYGHPVSTNHAIFERDKWMVTELADVILADLRDAVEVSIGTCMELAWASLVGIHSVVVLPEDNPHQHVFVLEAADVIFEDINDALVYLHQLRRG